MNYMAIAAAHPVQQFGPFVSLGARLWSTTHRSRIGELVAVKYCQGVASAVASHCDISSADQKRRALWPEAYAFLYNPSARLSQTDPFFDTPWILCWKRSPLVGEFASRFVPLDRIWIELQIIVSRALDARVQSLEQAAPQLGLRYFPENGPLGEAQAVAELFLGLIERQRWSGWTDVLETGRAAPGPDLSRFGFDMEFLLGLPETAGVYVMKDRLGDVLYIGKSGNLRRRVQSYFHPTREEQPKAAALLGRLYTIDVVPLGSALEASLVEARMIRTLSPAVNLQLRVHEPPLPYLQERDLVIVCPSVEARMELFLLRKGRLIEQLTIKPRQRKWKQRAEKRIQAIFFDDGPTAEIDPEDSFVVLNFLRAHGDRINFVEVAQYPSAGEIVRILENYFADPESLRDRVIFR